MGKIIIVTGVIGSDVHTIGYKLLAYGLQKAGFKIVDLGISVSQEEFINAAIETRARAILVSSLYGHGEIDCQGLREKCQESGLKNILLYVGGNLVVGKQEWGEVERKFKNMGFDRVAPPGTTPDAVANWLNADLAEGG
jgi:methylaspartate mutase sigma subunit